MKLVFWTSALAVCSALPVAEPESSYSDNRIVKRSFTAYGQGFAPEALDAPGLPNPVAYKGFPIGGVGPAQSVLEKASKLAKSTPGLVPVGVNPVNCTIKDGQRPVVLIPGTGSTVYSNFAYIGPRLAQEEGLCVYSFNHNGLKDPVTGKPDATTGFTGYIEDSAASLGAFVDEVLALTGAEQVDLLGHSQGAGAVPYFYLKNLMKGSKVHKLVAIEPSLGTEAYGLNLVFKYLLGSFWSKIVDEASEELVNGGSYFQQLSSSSLMKALHSGHMTVPGVKYVNIANRYDNILQPYQNCFVNEADRDIKNFLIQDYCWKDFNNHGGVAYDPTTYQIAVNQLLDKNDPIPCSLQMPNLF